MLLALSVVMTGIKTSRITDALVTTGGAGVLAATMAALDTRVRDFFASMLALEPTRQLAIASTETQRFAHTVMETIGYHGTEDTWLVFPAIAGVALLILMFRS